MAGDLMKKEENVGLEPLIAKAASRSKLLKFQALDYTKALMVPFVGSPVTEEPVEEESAVNAPTGIFKVLVRTSNSQDLADKVDRLVENGSSSNVTFFRVFKVSARPKMKAKRKILALHESVRPALLDELIKRFDRVRVTTNPSAKDIRYTLDYIVNWYMVGYMTNSYSFNPERQELSSQVQLVVQDMLKDETVLEQVLIINKDFMTDVSSDDESILDDFYQEAARTVAQEVSPLFD